MPEPGTSWDTPILFDDVEDFLAYIGNSSNDGKYVSLSDPHIQNGQFVGSGNGTENNPYVVSTYREMLLVTGASEVYECKLMDDDQDISDFTQSRRYWYNSGEPGAQTVYCQYDPTPTLVNCSRIWPTGRYTIYNYCHTDFNGWTLMNLVVTTNNSRTAGFISNGGTVNPGNKVVRRVIFGNAKFDVPNYDDMSIINCDITDSMIQLDVDATMVPKWVEFTNNCSRGGTLTRVTMHFKYTGCSENIFGASYGNDSAHTPQWYDCIIDFDVNTNILGTYWEYQYIQPTRCTIKGTIKYNTISSGTKPFFRYASDTIFDHQEISGTGSRPKKPSNCGRCVYNKTKLTYWTDTANCLMGVTTAELLQPEVLQQKGLSIGVDT